MLRTWLARFRDRYQLPEGFTLADLRASLRTKPTRGERFEVSSLPVREPVPFLAEQAMSREGEPFIKWWHYFDVYDRELGDLAAASRTGSLGEPIRILEIGVWRGGSLGLWRDYFGPSAVIMGIDIDPESARFDGIDASIRIGSQADTAFLASVVQEMGGLDVVIDDGSHQCSHVIETLRALWPLLSDDGVYCIEDLHTSYWPAWGGGLRRPSSSIEALKALIDELHQPYFEKPSGANLGITRDTLEGVAFYDSVAVLRKRSCPPPRPFRGGVG